MSEFYKYFKENMDSLNLAAPNELFATAQLSIANVMAILTLVDKLGPSTTIRLIIGAGTRLEKLSVVGSMLAAGYVGAVIGSIAVATGRSVAGGTTLAEAGESLASVLRLTSRHNLNRPYLTAIFYQSPEYYNGSKLRRRQ